MNITIRIAQPTDATAISALIYTVTLKHVHDDFLTEEGKQFFLKAISTQAIRQYLETNYCYWLAESEGKLIGLIGMREHQHIFHLFVVPAAHRKGVASALWAKAQEAAIAYGYEGKFTVYSSTFAQSLYQKWGFRPTQEAYLIKNGHRSIPMELEVLVG